MLLKFGEVLKGMQERKRDERGFTLIELLVVVIIIGILAAIAIPVFLNQRERAYEASVESDLRNAITIDTALITDGGEGLTEEYGPNTQVGPEDAGFTTSDGVTIDATTEGSIAGSHEDLPDNSTLTYNKGTGAYTGTGAFADTAE